MLLYCNDHPVKHKMSLIIFKLILSNFSLILSLGILDFLRIGDFNVRISSRWRQETKTLKDTQTQALTCTYGLNQFISSPTHILQNSPSCMNLIFINQPNIVVDSRVHLSLHANCHQQIIYPKPILKIKYPPPTCD